MKQLLLSFSLLTEEVEKKKMLQKTGEEEEIGWILQTIDPTDKIFLISTFQVFSAGSGGEVLSASISSFPSPFDSDARGELSG